MIYLLFPNNSLHTVALLCLSFGNIVCHLITHCLHMSSNSAFVFTSLIHLRSSVSFVPFPFTAFSWLFTKLDQHIHCEALLPTFPFWGYWRIASTLCFHLLSQLFKNMMVFPLMPWQLNCCKTFEKESCQVTSRNSSRAYQLQVPCVHAYNLLQRATIDFPEQNLLNSCLVSSIYSYE